MEFLATFFSLERAIIEMRAGALQIKGEVEIVHEHAFIKGVGLGALAGAAIGMAMVPRKKVNMRKAAGKAMKTVGHVMENLSDEMGF